MPLLRPAHRAEVGAVTALVRAAYASWVPRIGREPAPMTADYAGAIARGEVTVLEDAGLEGAGPEDAGDLVGVLVLIPEATALMIENVAVAPAFQGRGHGRTLLAFAEQTARAGGYARLRLYTNAAMTENIALYARGGFAETRRVTEHGLHRVYMEKPLDR